MGEATQSWETRVAMKLALVESGLPASWKPLAVSASGNKLQRPIAFFEDQSQLVKNNLFTQEELDITEKHTAASLLKLMAAGSLTSTQVTTAYCKRAVVAQELMSCLTETMYAQALERAQFLDDYLKTEKKTFGPLHGLPISVKDSFNIKGVHSTLGYVSFLDKPVKTEESALVNILLRAGAVLYVKTNIPMTLMTADSHNNVFGRTLNPYNTRLTAGGSSGGEGALVAMKGSPLGVGTDIAGSIRIPSLCCGVYGFKPSVGRIPYGGQTSPARAGMPGIKACAGPLARSVADLEIFTAAVVNFKPWEVDSTAHAVPWRSLAENPASECLTIGIQAEDPKFPLHPPIRRAIEGATAALRKAGHVIVPLPHTEGSSAELANTLAWQYFALDPENTAKKHIDAGEEPTVPSVINTTELARKHIDPAGLVDVPDLNARRAAYRKSWLQVFQVNKLDVVLGPSAQHAAVAHDTYGMCPYTTMWNVLDYPACVIPYCTVSKTTDLPAEIKEPAIGPNFDPVELDGLPCSIQIIAPHFHDEELLRAVKIVDRVLNN